MLLLVKPRSADRQRGAVGRVLQQRSVGGAERTAGRKREAQGTDARLLDRELHLVPCLVRRELVVRAEDAAARSANDQRLVEQLVVDHDLDQLGAEQLARAGARAPATARRASATRWPRRAPGACPAARRSPPPASRAECSSISSARACSARRRALRSTHWISSSGSASSVGSIEEATTPTQRSAPDADWRRRSTSARPARVGAVPLPGDAIERRRQRRSVLRMAEIEHGDADRATSARDRADARTRGWRARSGASQSSTVLPIGAASNAPRRSASERFSERRLRSSSANTATFDRSSSASNGLST